MSSFPLFSHTGESPFFPAAKKSPGRIRERLVNVPNFIGVTPASQLEVRPVPEMVSSGIAAIDALTGGIPRGCLTEICGPASSGRTSVLLAVLATATRRQEACALVDVSDAFNPQLAMAGGMNFAKLLWVRCGTRNPSHSPQRPRGTERRSSQPMASEVEQALRVTDLLLQSGGFGLVAVDLGDVHFKTARRIPLASWFRFQRAVERTPTVLFVVTQSPCAQTCAALLLKVSGKKLSAVSSSLPEKNSPAHAQLLHGLQVEGELLRSRLERKPVQSATAAFIAKVQAG